MAQLMCGFIVIQRVPLDDTVSTQSFPLTITVSFVYRDESQTRDYVPPAPPVLFKVPYDVFYPFSNSATPRFASSKIVLFNVGISAAFVLVCVSSLALMIS